MNKMNKWWLRTPILLLCALMIGGTVAFGKVVSAASGDPEFGEIIVASLDAFKMVLEHFYEMLVYIW